jgi:hypothetical protein
MRRLRSVETIVAGPVSTVPLAVGEGCTEGDKALQVLPVGTQQTHVGLVSTICTLSEEVSSGDTFHKRLDALILLQNVTETVTRGADFGGACYHALLGRVAECTPSAH